MEGTFYWILGLFILRLSMKCMHRKGASNEMEEVTLASKCLLTEIELKIQKEASSIHNSAFKCPDGTK